MGRATSIWTLMDIEARRITRSSYVDERHSIAHTLRPATPLPMSVKPINAKAIVESVTPKFSDFNLNRHVNNTKYLDWCCNALGMEHMKQNQIMSFDVNYESEITEDCKIRTDLWMDGDQFTYCGFDGDDKRFFAIGGTLSKR